MEDEMPLPTHEELSKMSAEQLIGLWRLVRDFRMKMMGAGPLPLSAIQEMEKITPDRLMASIVEDNRKAKGVPAPSGLIPDEKPEPKKVRGSGWQKPVPLDVPPGVKYCDEIADHFAALDRLDTIRQVMGKGEK
jgi:hypothetical protein